MGFRYWEELQNRGLGKISDLDKMGKTPTISKIRTRYFRKFVHSLIENG